MLVDSHCHLDRLDLTPYGGDLANVINDAQARGVGHLLCVGIDRNNAVDVMRIAKEYPNVSASVGFHPMDISGDEQEADFELLAQWAADDCVIAIGETGLDYFYSRDSAELQAISFQRHLQLSKSLAKPVIVHTREARDETIQLIKTYGDTDIGGVLHCFTETIEMARAALDLNYFISFSGIVTFKNAAELREVVKYVPLDRILVETDSPFLAPVPYRGKKNVPQYVVEVAECVAALKGVSFDALAEITTDNFQRLFKLAL